MSKCPEAGTSLATRLRAQRMAREPEGWVTRLAQWLGSSAIWEP